MYIKMYIYWDLDFCASPLASDLLPLRPFHERGYRPGLEREHTSLCLLFFLLLDVW